MHTILFTPKLFRQRHLLQFLIPLFALLGLNAPQTAMAQATITSSSVFIDKGDGNITHGAKPNPDPDIPPITPLFDGAKLGSYDINTGVLLLNGGEISTTEVNGTTVQSATMYYTITPVNGVPGAATGFVLPQVSFTGSSTRNFSFSSAAINLVSAVTAAGTYNVDVYFQAPFRLANGRTGTQTDDNNQLLYQAEFTVTGTPTATTVWTGTGGDSNWFNPDNWTRGVPNATTDARVPNLGNSTSTRTYPEIFSGAIAEVTSSNPRRYDNTGSGPAAVRNLNLEGTSLLSRGILRLVQGRLNVHGNLINQFNSFEQGTTTILALAGADQTITGGVGFQTVHIEGGGTKSLTGVMEILKELKFISGRFENNATSSSFVDFQNGDARIVGETDASSLIGSVRIGAVAVPGVRQNFGGIGMGLTFIGADPGIVEVTRITGLFYASIPRNPNAVSIKRVFRVRPSNLSAALSANVSFSYLDSEAQNIPTNSTPPISRNIDENDLVLFISNNSGNTFTPLGRTSINTSTNELTRDGVTGVNTTVTFTLGDRLNPLPVTLTTFAAKRVGVDALLSWQTASELYSKGFNVQVSTDGKEFRTIGFVPSASPNSVRVTNYHYTDAEKNKSGLRYYRLQQVDLDGQSTYFAPRAVSFDGQNLTAGLVAYPSPFTSEMRLSLNSAVQGQGLVSIKDMTGRSVAQRQVALGQGSNDVEMANLTGLKSGIYLVHVTLPSGQVQNVRVVKQ